MKLKLLLALALILFLVGWVLSHSWFIMKASTVLMFLMVFVGLAFALRKRG